MNLKHAIQLGLAPRGGESNEIGLRVVEEGAGSTGTLTFTGTGAEDDTITIGTVTYTLKAAPAAAYEVDIGATSADTAANLMRAINLMGTAGTQYGTGTEIHPSVWASVSGSVVTVTARILGTVGDTIASTVSSADASWGAATLSGGVNLGATPANSPNWLSLCHTGEQLSPNPQYDRSERICATVGGGARMMRKRALAAEQPGGTVNGEVMYSDLFSLLLKLVMGGVWIADPDNAGQDLLYVDIGQQTLSLEKYFVSLPTRFERFTGTMVGQLDISIPWGSKATYTATLMSRNHDATQTTSLVGSGTVTGEPDNEIMAGARDFANLKFDNAAIPGLVVQSVDLSIVANLRPVQGLGSLGPSAHRQGDLSMTGNLGMYFGGDSFDLYLDALANTDKRLDFDMLDPDGNKLGWRMPKINLGAVPGNAQGRNQDVIPSVPFEAHTDRVYIIRDPA